LIASCFGYGAFTVTDVLQTQRSLFTLALGVPAFMMVKVLASGFYARQDISTPVKIGALSMVINTLLCSVFVWFFAHAGLTLASSLAGYVNCGLLLVLLVRRKIYQPLPGWSPYILRLVVANAALCVYLILMQGKVQYWMGFAPIMRLSVLLTHVIAASALYLLVLGITGLRLNHFRGPLKE
ncbi:MAG: lipid II flippase MurJ, partial [Legionellales bacterium]